MEGKVVGEYRPDRVDRLMTEEMTDPVYSRRVMHFLEAIDAATVQANTAVIRQALPGLDRDSFLRLAVRVAELRADYVRFGLTLAEQRHPDAGAIRELAEKRQAYEEMMAVFEAMERLVERGYSLVAKP